MTMSSVLPQLRLSIDSAKKTEEIFEIKKVAIQCTQPHAIQGQPSTGSKDAEIRPKIVEGPTQHQNKRHIRGADTRQTNTTMPQQCLPTHT